MENNKIQKLNKFPSTSSLSRNYSGSVAYFTPLELVNCILNGIDFFLLNKFNNSSGIIGDDLEFIEPAAGLMIFPIHLVDYVKKRTKPEEFDSWISKTLLKKLHAFEINPKIYHSAKIKWEKKVKPLIHPKPSKKSISNLHCETSIKTNQNDDSLISKLPLNSSDKLIIFGNPPYAVSSQVKSPWIQDLIHDYKKDLNRKGKKRILGLKGIQDDYVKFIRLAQWKIADQDNIGILAYVVNNYFLDGDIFRGMRVSLKNTFDEIWIINLHGDPKKKQPNITDENVFDIQTGICLFFALKYKNKKTIPPNEKGCKIFYSECIGSKAKKFKFVLQNFKNVPFESVPERLDHEFIPISQKEIELERKYNEFPYLPNIFKRNIIGIQSLHDSLITHPDISRLKKIINCFYDGTYSKLEFKDEKNQNWVIHQGVSYHDARDWKIEYGLEGSANKAIDHIIQWQWRGFDKWWVSYDENMVTKGSSSYSLMQFLLPHQNNLAIGVSRVSRKASGENSVFITKNVAESHFIEGGSGIGDYLFPLKINRKLKRVNDWERPLNADEYNFNSDFLNNWKNRFALDEKDLFYYIYGILWTPGYRKQYKIFLKKDFPHIPFIFSASQTKKIADIGRKLCNCQILSFSFSSKDLNDWPINPNYQSNTYEIRNFYYDPDKKRIYFNKTKKNETVNSNENFWIGDITPEMWSFSIGGIPQLSLWLKNRHFSTEIKKYSFNRGINRNELQNLFKICISIKKSINLVKNLENIYENFI
ncbi:MAG: type ISP restriction/modification enzyme [Promethearchaeota archaeon]